MERGAGVECVEKVWRDSTLLLWNAVELDFVVERLAVDAEEAGGLGLVAVRAFQGLEDAFFLDVFVVEGEGGGRWGVLP